jgi:hypothetical protein
VTAIGEIYETLTGEDWPLPRAGLVWSVVNRVRAGRQELCFGFWQGQEIFLFSEALRLALGPTQPSVQWVLGALRFFP